MWNVGQSGTGLAHDRARLPLGTTLGQHLEPHLQAGWSTRPGMRAARWTMPGRGTGQEGGTPTAGPGAEMVDGRPLHSSTGIHNETAADDGRLSFPRTPSGR